MAVSIPSSTLLAHQGLPGRWRWRHSLLMIGLSLLATVGGFEGMCRAVAAGDLRAAPCWALLLILGGTGLVLVRFCHWLLSA